MTCRYSGVQPIICCEKDKPVEIPAEDGCPKLERPKLNTDKPHIAWSKCLDYQRYFNQCISAGPSMSPYKVRKYSCSIPRYYDRIAGGRDATLKEFPHMIPRPFDPRLSDDVILTPKKRPFCNAFTGCGRKRSQATPGMPMNEVVRQRQFVDEDTIGSLIDSDNAIDELSRQILSEAKLWEAIQDASAEIARRKQKDIYN